MRRSPAAAIVLAGIGCALAAQPRTGALVFEGARVVTGERRPPIEDAALVVDAGRITAVGPRANVKAPPGATTIDVRGKTIMPALLDAHSHLDDIRNTRRIADVYLRGEKVDRAALSAAWTR